jgi:hypothetical protein
MDLHEGWCHQCCGGAYDLVVLCMCCSLSRKKSADTVWLVLGCVRLDLREMVAGCGPILRSGGVGTCVGVAVATYSCGLAR